MYVHRTVAIVLLACAASACGADSATRVVTVATPSSLCSITSPTRSVGIDAAAADGQLAIATNRECQWTATSDVDWIALSPKTGQGDSSIGYSIGANAVATLRRGTISVNDYKVEVTQAAAACRFSVSPAAAAVDPTGGRITVAVTAQTGCSWTATSQVNWMGIAEGAPTQNGNGTLTLRVDANGPTPRTGTVTIANQVVTISQGGAPANPIPGACTVTLSAPGETVPAAGVNGSVTVSGAAGCAWTAVSDVSWIVITAGLEGSGGGVVDFSVAANPAASPRSGTIVVAGQVFTVSQDAATPGPGPCTFDLSATAQSAGAGGGPGQISVTASASTCTWAASTTTSWLSISSGASATGSGTTTYAVAANTAAQRVGTLTVAGQTVTVTQAAAPAACTFSLSAPSQSVASGGASGTVNVTASAGSCAWTATGAPSWVTITGGASGTGNGTVQFTVASNPNQTTRSATLTIGGQPFAISQAAAPAVPCTFSLSGEGQAFAAAGGTATVAVSASAGSCAWTSSGIPPWITILNNTGTGNGNGTVGYTVAANPNQTARTVTLTIAGKPFLIAQEAAPAPPPCTFTLSAPSQSVVAGGASGTVNVTASAGSCAWTATGAPSWVTITGGASGTGNGTVRFTVAANPNQTARNVTLTIAGQPFAISQDAAPAPCTFTLSAPSQSVVAGGASGTVNVTASAGSCAWTATGAPSWVTITGGASGTGNGTVQFTVAANPNQTTRSATLTIAGHPFAISQAAAPAPPCTFTVAPTSQSVGAAASTGQVTITASAQTCAWTATSAASWLTISSGGSGMGNGTTRYSVAANSTNAVRTGTLTVAGQTVTFTQARPTPVSD
ncbi:MAG: BACON domain-containing carbohydrate-binding protein [Acidobacteriota bacterium]